MMEIKVCGMRETNNIQSIVDLGVDYIGFIFFEGSPRFFGEHRIIPEVDSKVKKIGVFVNESVDNVGQQIGKHRLDGVQLHGDETPAYIHSVKKAFPDVLIWKAFRMKDASDLQQIKVYEGLCDRYIFDTKGKQYGGNGTTWNYHILKDQEIETSFFLSGGIDEQVDKEILMNIHPNCIGLDLNSKFELEPGLKDVNKLKTFIEK